MVVPRPFIDKLTVSLKPPSIEIAEQAYKQYWGYKDHPDAFSQANVKKLPGYGHARRIVLEGLQNKRWPALHLDIDNRAKKVRRLRLDFVPEDLQNEGLNALNFGLLNILVGGWGTFVEFGRISRIDVAVDIPEITMDSVWVLPKKAGETHYWRSNKGIETVKWGKSKGNETLIYSRKAKREAQGQQWDKHADVRIERRLRNQNMPLSSLACISNPFDGIAMVVAIPKPPPIKTNSAYVWSLFTDAVKVRGLTPALNLLPGNRKAEFRKHIKNNQISWWQPDAIWMGWEPMLNELGLLKMSMDGPLAG